MDRVCAKSMHFFVRSSLELCKLGQLGKAHPKHKQCFFLWLNLQQPGLNHRFFAGYKPEDFIGKIAIVASAGNNENCEYIALKRFYLGSPALGLAFFGVLFSISHLPGEGC